MTPTRRINRRSFLGRVAGGAAIGGGALAMLAGSAHALQDDRSGLTDCDRGAGADQAGNGRHAGNFSDGDSGSGADPACHGRQRFRYNSIHGGRPQTGTTDRDTGPNADPINYGTNMNGQGYTGVTDHDSGAGADPANYGRGPRR